MDRFDIVQPERVKLLVLGDIRTVEDILTLYRTFPSEIDTHCSAWQDENRARFEDKVQILSEEMERLKRELDSLRDKVIPYADKLIEIAGMSYRN